jgi:ABC-type proline/glycine betaine transport system ATPase subunit
MDSFKEINEKDRKTVVLVTHDAKYLPYAHRVFYMRDGALRRIAVNPEKEQVLHMKPGETIVTEIELLNRLYPYAEPIELKVKSVVNFATQTMGFDQLERLEKGVLQVLKGAFDESMFEEFLQRSMKSGGVGILGDETKEITRRVFTVVHRSKEVAKYREEMRKDGMFLHQQKFIDRIFDYVSEEMGVVSTAQQMKIADRVGGIISADDFESRLALPFELGGIHYDEVVAHRTSRYLEKLIAQGAYVIQANELLGAHT